jgi:hypothetical protein
VWNCYFSGQIGIDSITNKVLSLYLTNEMIPNPAFNGVGNGSWMVIANAETFKIIKMIKAKLK